jgi:predicted unusual protein kinase regulating ubiquinone biosynthesis (AarF/ABC1/UbiB family)
MEWIEGEKGPWMQDGERLLTIGLQCSVLQMLDSGFFHADCHRWVRIVPLPCICCFHACSETDLLAAHRGNLLRMQDGRLAYLDFGMMCTVPPEERYALVGATLGLQNRDVRLVASSLVKMGFLPDESSMDVVVPALERAVNEASDGQGASRLNFTKLNTNVNALSAELQFRVPPFYSLIVRTLTMLEGLALSVDPDFRLVMGAYPYIAKQVRTLFRRLGNPPRLIFIFPPAFRYPGTGE